MQKFGFTISVSLAVRKMQTQEKNELGGEREVLKMYAYEKAVLKTYKQTETFIKTTKNTIVKGAYASYRSFRPAQAQAEKLIDLCEKKSEIEELKNAIDESLASLKPCYAYILGEKYGVGEYANAQPMQKNNAYYRKSAYALGKFVQEMRSRGFTNEVYESICKRYGYIDNAHKSIVAMEKRVIESGNLLNVGKSLKPERA